MRRAVAAFARSEGAFPAAYSRMLVSTKAAAINLFTFQSPNRFSPTSPILRGEEFLKLLRPLRAKFLILAQLTQIFGYKLAHRSIMLSGLAAGAPVDLIIYADCDVLHIFTVTVKL